MEKKQNKYNKIKKCEINFPNKKILLHNCNNLNNLKTTKYFTNCDSENETKKAITKYRENISKKNNINNITNKTTSTSDVSKIFSQNKSKKNINSINNKNKNKSFKIDKKILSYAEPRLKTKIKEFHKIQPKILESFITDKNYYIDNFLNNTNETIMNESDDISSELEVIKDFSGINKFKNYNETSEDVGGGDYFLTEIEEKNKLNLNEIFNINDINFDFLIMIEKLYDELIKDIEINKMDIYL